VKLLRLKLTYTESFRSLQPGFEYHFRTEWELEEELQDCAAGDSKIAGKNDSKLRPFV